MNGVSISVDFNLLLSTTFPRLLVEPSQLQRFSGQSGGSLLQFLVHHPSRTPELTLTHSFLSPFDFWVREMPCLRSSISISIVKSSDARLGDKSIDFGEVGGMQKHASGHECCWELHWMLHVTDLTSATLLTHTTGDDAGSSTCELGAASQPAASWSMPSENVPRLATRWGHPADEGCEGGGID